LQSAVNIFCLSPQVTTSDDFEFCRPLLPPPLYALASPMSIGIPPTISLFPPFSSYSSSRKPTLPLPGIVLPKLPALVRDRPSSNTGLATPPVDDMSATYQPPLGAYDGHGMQHNFPPTASAGCTKMSMMDSRDSQQYTRLPPGQSLQRHMQQPQSQTIQVQSQLQSQAKLVPAVQSASGSGYAAATQLGPSSCHSTRNSTPGSEIAMNMASDGTSSRRGSETLVYHSLQIPKCISPQGGNLAEFAAQVSSPSHQKFPPRFEPCEADWIYIR
jgi:hypothetical protein